MAGITRRKLRDVGSTGPMTTRTGGRLKQTKMKKIAIIVLIIVVTVLAAIFLGAKPAELLTAGIATIIYMVLTVALIRWLDL